MLGLLVGHRRIRMVGSGRARLAGRDLWHHRPADAERHRSLRRGAARCGAPPTASSSSSSCSRSASCSGSTCWWVRSDGSTGDPPSTPTPAPISAGCSRRWPWFWVGDTSSSRSSWSPGSRARWTPRPGARPSWSAPLLTGVALATAGLSAAWALRPRHALVAGGWIVLASASIVGHWMVPPAMGGSDEPAAESRLVERIGRSAYRLETLEETELRPSGDPAPPRVAVALELGDGGAARGRRLDRCPLHRAGDSHACATDLDRSGSPRDCCPAVIPQSPRWPTTGFLQPAKRCSTAPGIPSRAPVPPHSWSSRRTRSVPRHRHTASPPRVPGFRSRAGCAASRWRGHFRRATCWAAVRHGIASGLGTVARPAARDARPVRRLGHAGPPHHRRRGGLARGRLSDARRRFRLLRG